MGTLRTFEVSYLMFAGRVLENSVRIFKVHIVINEKNGRLKIVSVLLNREISYASSFNFSSL